MCIVRLVRCGADKTALYVRSRSHQLFAVSLQQEELFVEWAEARGDWRGKGEGWSTGEVEKGGRGEIGRRSEVGRSDDSRYCDQQGRRKIGRRGYSRRSDDSRSG